MVIYGVFQSNYKYKIYNKRDKNNDNKIRMKNRDNIVLNNENYSNFDSDSYRVIFKCDTILFLKTKTYLFSGLSTKKCLKQYQNQSTISI